MLGIIKYAILIALSISLASTLECYSCSEQDRNDDKCGQNVEQCKQHQEYCLSTVKWGSAPYFTEGAPKQYFISKQCATKAICDQKKKKRFQCVTVYPIMTGNVQSVAWETGVTFL